MSRVFTRRRRRGLSTVQWCVLAGLVTIAVIATISALGGVTNTRLNGTAGAVGNPADLANMAQ